MKGKSIKLKIFALLLALVFVTTPFAEVQAAATTNVTGYQEFYTGGSYEGTGKCTFKWEYNDGKSASLAGYSASYLQNGTYAYSGSSVKKWYSDETAYATVTVYVKFSGITMSLPITSSCSIYGEVTATGN
ncbi:MAG: hypothetical protein ACERKZ_05570 [Lachnotalea sp.]